MLLKFNAKAIKKWKQKVLQTIYKQSSRSYCQFYLHLWVQDVFLEGKIGFLLVSSAQEQPLNPVQNDVPKC